MKYLEPYKLFEFLNNKNLVKSTLKKYLRKILSINKNTDIKDVYENKRSYQLIIITEDMFEKETEKILYQCKNQLFKSGTFMNWSKHKSHKLKLNDDDYDDLSFDIDKTLPLDITFKIYVKDVLYNRKKPPKYLYHATTFDKYESIIKNGLEIKNNLNYKDTPELDTPGAIFASSEKDFWESMIYDNYILSIFEIDTTKIDNIWFEDYNILNDDDKKVSFLTYEPIPSSALKLITDDKGQFKK